MKDLLPLTLGLTVLVLLPLTPSAAEELQRANASIVFDPIVAFDVDRPEEAPPLGGNRTVTCPSENVLYSAAKATVLQGLNINNATSAQGVAQLFEAPGPVTISGFDFYGWVTNPGDMIDLTATISLADASGFPTAPLRSVVVTMSNEVGTGTLPELLNTATFASPVTVNASYVLAVENHSADNIALVSNDFTADDGAGEYLAAIDLFGTWFNGADVAVGPDDFDADWLFEPAVTFDLTADFAAAPGCLAAPDTVIFTNNSSAFASSRFYSQEVFNGTPEQAFEWDYDDGSALENALAPSHAYASTGPFAPSLETTITGWSRVCTDTVIRNLGQGPTADWSSSQSGLTATFSDASLLADSHLWDFGDGNTSTAANPSHTYAAAGTYTVCLDTTNLCSTDTACNMVTVALGTDLSVTKTDGVVSAAPGGSIVYTIVTTNAGPVLDPAATLTDSFPAALSCTYTSAAAGGATGNTAAGSGDLSETLSLPVGSSVTYTATCSIDPALLGTLSNTATVTASGTDPTPGNNSATDADTVLAPEADLTLTVTDGVAQAGAGDLHTYTIVVSNAGPSDAPGTTVTTTFPAALSGVTWTCVATAGSSCTASGSADIADVVYLAAGGQVTYSAEGLIDAMFTGTLESTASVVAGPGVVDPNPAGDVASDSTRVGLAAVIPTLSTTGLLALLALVVLFGLRRLGDSA